METEIRFDAACEKPKAVIYTAEMTDEVNNAVRLLTQAEPKILTGIRDGAVEIIDEASVVRFYTEDGRVWAETKDG